MQYDWIDFYTEFATKLLSFKTDRKTLIQKMYAVYDTVGISVPKLESGDEIIDIDPFTIFGTFNKGITNANRIAILNGIASEFGIAATVPSNFDGIPVLNNLKATFYGFKDDRKANDIDNLWSLFEVALALADNDTEDNRQKFSEAYDKVHDQLCIRWNITMGLYWIRPYTFINLDSRNRWFIADVQNMPGEFVVAAEKKLKKVPFAADYLEIKDLCKKALDAIAEISADKKIIGIIKGLLGKYRMMKVMLLMTNVENTAIPFGAPELMKIVKDNKRYLIFDDISNIKLCDLSVSITKKYAKPIDIYDAFYVNENELTKIKTVKLS